MKADGTAKKIVDQISGIFLPVINTITACSLIKSVLILLVSSGVLTSDNGIYRIFYAVSDGFFYFLPAFLALTAAKQWGLDPFISFLIPVAFLYPGITSVLENAQTFTFIGLTVPATIYHSSVIPVILAVGLQYFIEKPCDKFIPEAVRGFLKPVVCMLIILPFTFLVFGPLGSWIGNGLTKVFFSIYRWNSICAGAFMGFAIQPMVTVGAHWSIVPVCLNSIATEGYDVIMPLVGGAVYGQAGASFAIALMSKNSAKRKLAIQCGVTACLGVTEPCLYSITVPRGFPMLLACIAGAAGGIVAGLAGTHCLSFAFPSFLTCVAFVGPGFVPFLLSMILGLILGFILTMLFYKEPEDFQVN